MNLPPEVTLREVAPRDGFLSLRDFLPTDQKLQIIESLAQAGISHIEATSFVSSKAVPQLRDAADLMARVPRNHINYAAMVPNLTGAQHAIAAKADQLVVLVSATEAHNKKNVRRSIAESLAEFDAIFAVAKENKIPVIGAVAVSFGCPYQGDVPETDVIRIAESYLSRGAISVILADTTGMATPDRVQRMVGQFQDRLPRADIILHFHNNRGTAMANLLSALTAGTTRFDTALGGMGGCPYVPQAAGNLPTEDVVYMLEEMGINTGIDLEAIIRAARLLQKILGYELPGQVMKSGPRDPKLAAGTCGIDQGF
ncbi:MAG: hydroxymethylglutaryl-CoA lyase [Deltaproteobacteria bacterium]|nr:MAG: hydroxymethylglutaryl-CoA lyase [Deltaproteobacteria bacterium]